MQSLLDWRPAKLRANISGSASAYWTPLCVASRNRHLEMINLLLSQGANPSVVAKDGWSSLGSAAADCNAEVFKALLAHKSFETVQDKRSMCGTIANTLACYRQTNLLRYIVQHKNVDLQTPDSLNRTPLLFTARGGRDQTLEYLMGRGLPLDVLDAKGDGLVSYTASSGYPQLFERALEQGLDELSL
jgi:ankyrin repeat protein